jgi:hypothetical protein
MAATAIRFDIRGRHLVQRHATGCNAMQRGATGSVELKNEPTDAVFDFASPAGSRQRDGDVDNGPCAAKDPRERELREPPPCHPQGKEPPQ